MANVIYAGTEDGKAHKAKAIYIGNNGAAKKAKKIYVGVNGQAKLAWSGFTGKWIIPVVKYDKNPEYYGNNKTPYESYATQSSRFAIYTGNSLSDDELNGKFVRSSILKTNSNANWGLTLNSVCSGNGVYIAVIGGDGVSFNQYYRSTDGYIWTLVNFPNPDASHGYSDFCSMCKFINGKFYYLYAWSNNIGIMSSSDGLTWTNEGSISFSEENLYPDDIFYAKDNTGAYKWFVKIRTGWQMVEYMYTGKYYLYSASSLNPESSYHSPGWTNLGSTAANTLCGISDALMSGWLYDMIQNDTTGDLWFAVATSSGIRICSVQTTGSHIIRSSTDKQYWRQLVNNGNDGTVAGMIADRAYIYPANGDISNPTIAGKGNYYVGFDDSNTLKHRNAVVIPDVNGAAYCMGGYNDGYPYFTIAKFNKNDNKGYGGYSTYYIGDYSNTLSGDYVQRLRNHNQAFCLGKG